MCGDEMREKKVDSPIKCEDKVFFQSFYEEYKNFIYYIACRVASNPTDCEDLVQDTVVRLIKKIPVLRELSRCKTAKYIVLTIKTAYLDNERRKQKDNLLFLEDDALDAVLAEQLRNQNTEQKMFTGLAVARLKDALSKRDWMALEAKYILGMSQEEIGKLIGVAPNSVRMVLCRAREKARIILEEIQKEEGDGND